MTDFAMQKRRSLLVSAFSLMMVFMFASFSVVASRNSPVVLLHPLALLRPNHATISGLRNRNDNNHYNSHVVLMIRGGGTKKAGAAKKKKKMKKNKAKQKIKRPTKQATRDISQALQEKDAAQALGDAVRERASQWRKSPFLETIDASVSSVGSAMGAADHRENEQTAGGVQAATTAVVVHYFLKSHGGAHAVQSLCSFLAAMSGLGAVLLSSSKTASSWQLVLLRRCMLFAMTKHLAGILAACVLTARAVPDVGLNQARLRIQDLMQDPVAQYVFYAACLLLWLPKSLVVSTTTATTQAVPLWWQTNSIIPLLFTGPILLREIISTLFVLSDVFLLWVYSNPEDGIPVVLKNLASALRSAVNAVMSLVVTPQTWRTANALQRQAILARLVSRASLAMEVLVGLVLVFDAGLALARLCFGLGGINNSNNSASVPPRSLIAVLKSIACAHLYMNFLWTRRRKIRSLATRMRGGAADLPMYLLNVMLDPKAAMGLDHDRITKSDSKESLSSRTTATASNNNQDSPTSSADSWKRYLKMAVGVDED